MPNLIIKSNIKKKVKELQTGPGKEEEITSVADEVGRELERKVEDILRDGLKRARENSRRTLQARDL